MHFSIGIFLKRLVWVFRRERIHHSKRVL